MSKILFLLSQINFPILLLLVNLLLYIPLIYINKAKRKRNEQLIMVVISYILITLFIYFFKDIVELFNGTNPSTASVLGNILSIIFYLISKIVVLSYDTLIGDPASLLLFISLLFVIAYLFLKVLVLFSSSLINILTKRMLKTNYFHNTNKEGAELKDQFVFAGVLLRVIGYLFFISSAVALYYGVSDYWTTLIPLLILPVLETGFYLDGFKTKLKQFTINVEPVSSEINTKFDNLFEAFKKTFKEKLIAFSKKSNSKNFSKSEYRIKNKHLAHINETLIKEQSDFPIGYIKGLDILFSTNESKNVIFSNANNERYGLCLKILFNYTYLKNEKILIVVLDDHEKNKTLEWIQSLLIDEILIASDSSEFDFEKISYHIVVETIQEVLHKDILIENYHKFKYAIILDIKNFVRKNHLYLNTFLASYKSHVGHYPKILGFSNLSNQLETSFHGIFLSDSHDLQEIEIKHKEPNSFHLLVFKHEGIKKFQDYIGLNVGIHLGSEVPLASFAYEKGIKPIVLSSEMSAIDEELEGLEIASELESNIKENVKIISDRFFNNIGKQHKIFIVDDVSNLHQTIMKWKNYAVSDEKFLVVVSSPYLFRQYFTENIQLTLDNSLWYKEILPIGELNDHDKAFLLLSQLASSKVKKQDIQINRKSKITKPEIVDYINKFSEKQITPALLNVEIQNCFENGMYHSSIYYSVPDKTYYPDLNYYSFKSNHGNILGICLKDDIYNKYIKRMKIILHGKIYEIMSIDNEKREIHLIFRDTQEVCLYEVNKEITINSLCDYKKIRSITMGSLESSSYFVTANFNTAIEHFTEKKYAGITYNFNKRETAYIDKKILILKYGTKEKVQDKLRLALEYMFNEVFISLFPKTYHLLSIKVVTDQTGPSLVSNMATTENQLEIIFFETGFLNYHLLNTISDEENLKKVFMLIQDFIKWSLENKKPIPNIAHKDDMDFNALDKFIDQVLQGNNAVTVNRTKKFEAKEDTGIIHLCDFCANPLPISQFEILDDGRERCEECKNRSVDNLDYNYEDLIIEAIKYLESTYDIIIDQNLTVEIVNPKIISGILGKGYKPTPSYDPRSIGLAVSEGDNKTIYIENAAPYFRAMAVIVHELVHIWQFTNLNFNKMNNVKIEGQAQWVELTYVQKTFPHEEQYVECEINRNDDYGKGYHYVESLIQNNKPNPFEIYKDKFSK